MPVHVRSDIWNQFGGNPAGSGFRAVQTASLDTYWWQCSLPSPGTSSPVFSPDEATVYVGTLDGRLIAVDRVAGFIKWSVELAGGSSFAVQTPAVADDGTIYCLCKGTAEVRDERTPRVEGAPSFVVAVLPTGEIRWRVPIRPLPDKYGTVNCKLLSAPRIVSGPRASARIIFALRYVLVVPYPEVGGDGPQYVRALAIVDEGGTFRLFNRYENRKLFVDAQGGGGFDWDWGATLGGIDTPDLPEDAHPCLDTPVVFGSLPAREPLIIIAIGDEGIYRFRWNDQEGALAGAPQRFALENPFPAPVAFPNGLLVGIVGPKVTFLDSDTFTPYLPNPAGPVGKATVTGGLRHMYFVPRFGLLRALDANGTLWKHRELYGNSVAFPVLSANRLRVATTYGLENLSLDLSEHGGYALRGAINVDGSQVFPGSHCGLSSPAIASDGDIFVVGGSGFTSTPQALYRFTSGSPFRLMIMGWYRDIKRWWHGAGRVPPPPPAAPPGSLPRGSNTGMIQADSTGA